MNYTENRDNSGKKLYLMLLLVLFGWSFCALPGTAHALQPGDQLPPFQAPAMDGRLIDLSQLTANGPIMLVFWASWCSNCRREMPRIKELLQTGSGKKLQVITVNVGQNESMAKIQRFIKKTGLTYPVIIDQKSKITSLYRVVGVPTIFIAERGGRIVLRQYFVPDETVLREFLP